MSLLGKLATTFPRRQAAGGARPHPRAPAGALRPDAESRPDRAFESLFVTAPDDLRLHVRIYGARTGSLLPVVCLPGLAHTTADFHALATALVADPAKPRWVVALDYRGHGRSDYDREPRNYGLRRDLADLTAVLTALNLAAAAPRRAAFWR
jgi:alpha-beta hydrolase superfamily lysophospholipase